MVNDTSGLGLNVNQWVRRGGENCVHWRWTAAVMTSYLIGEFIGEIILVSLVGTAVLVNHLV